MSLSCLHGAHRRDAFICFLQAYSRLAAVLSSLHLSAAAVTALEQLTELSKSQGAGQHGHTASRLQQARSDVRRKQPVHQYLLLGVAQTCSTDEVCDALVNSS